MLIQIENYESLVSCHGLSVAAEAEREIHNHVARVCGAGAVVARLGEGRVGVRWNSVTGGRYVLSDLAQRCVFGEELSVDLNGWMQKDGPSLGAVLSVTCVAETELCVANSGIEQTWRQSQASIDMDTVAMVYQAIDAGRLRLYFQPVRGVQDLDCILYYECLIRILHDDSRPTLTPGSFIPCLERVRQMRCLDRHVMRCVFSELVRRPGICLGVNISAQSAVDDVWWASTFSDLASAPDVAHRLIIEITETSQLQTESARVFCERLRRLGCRIAVDDVGVGFGLETYMKIRKPDLIKIDASVLRDSSQPSGSSVKLMEMLDVVQGKASQVIVEGIESDRDLQIVKDVGVPWGQGYFLGVPREWEPA
ncbi:EAL domain-containing protein [Burkholderia diffusa]|uniref:EAL domain-containing protein n=1 Tax=Burkholderia diffusa TaxID=488732 RepID=UPI0018C89713|nr:EAL domain-containing protein [Burkholderia diffusa]